jgi:hypothetical protein
VTNAQLNELRALVASNHVLHPDAGRRLLEAITERDTRIMRLESTFADLVSAIMNANVNEHLKKSFEVLQEGVGRYARLAGKPGGA